MKYPIIMALMLTACGTDESETEKSLPVFRMDTDGKYALIGDTGSCSETLRSCQFNYRLKNPCTHGSFYLVYVKGRYAYTWVINDEKVGRGSWKWKITGVSDSEAPLPMLYAEEATTYFYCADDDIKKAGL